ncbi:MAG: ABC transporter substrate-binding protein [Rhizobiales bacterium 65-9]|nr:sugar ABC transporter substrate-binding protein [Hyphomicrobiales bacterium]OJY38134.1 MAG: ABC transporter substrate-binding protein [Rhizobiales bacterium 65-9]
MDSFHSGLSRRSVLAGGAAAGALALSGAPAFSQVNWKKFAGTKIEANLIKGPRGETLAKYHKEFTDLTGIEVGYELIPEQQQRQKAVIELTSGSPSFDVVHLSYHVQKRQFEKAGWLADLSGFIKDPSLTEAGLSESDFSAAGKSYATDEKGRLLSLPWSVDYFMLYYNKEMLAKKNIPYPQTIDEMIASSIKLTDAKNGEFGFVGRGLRNANLPMWASIYLGYGKDFIDDKGNLLTDGPEAVEATKQFQELMMKAAPPGVAGFNWMESQAAFLQGKVAFWLDGVGWAPPMEDPTRSRVVGKVGYGVIPKGKMIQASPTYGDGIGVVSNSKKKEASYLYCQWAISKLMGGRLLQAGGGVPFRNSVLDDPEVRSGVKMPKEWVDCVVGSAKVSKLGLPVIVPVTEFRDIIGAALTATLSGADPAAELKKATEQFKPILERSEKA